MNDSPSGFGSNGARTMVSIVKEDLRRRFEKGHRPSIKDYIEQYPDLVESRDGMMSLLYEEYCLREEVGEPLDPERFCEQYEPWRDSLISQLQYHAAFSRLASVHRPRPHFPEPGDSFLWFDLYSKLGEGGAGRVYLARDRNLGGKRVALKISLDKGNEPSIQGRLSHPNIVPVHQVEREPKSGLRGLCMPYSPGLSLDRVIERVFQVDPKHRDAKVFWDVLIGVDSAADEEPEISKNPGWVEFPINGSYERGAVWIVMKLAEALVHAHGHDVLHRDIKPANVLLTRRNGPMLLDFNLSQANDTPEEVENAACGGTLPYMAPEQLRAFLDPDLWSSLCPATDLYSLGLVLRELLTGIRPVPGKRGIPVARMVNEQLDLRRDDSFISARQKNPRVSPGLDAIIKKCLALREKDRYATAHDLVEDLNRYLTRRPLLHAGNPSVRERLLDASIRYGKRLAIAGGLLGFVTVVSLAVYQNFLAPEPEIVSTIQIVKEPEWRLYDPPRLVNLAYGVLQETEGDRSKKRDLAEEYLDLALRHNPDYAPAWRQKAYIAFQRNQLEESLNCFDKALEAMNLDHQMDPATLAKAFFDRSGILWTLGSHYQDQARLLQEAAGSLTPAAVELVENSRTRLTLSLSDLERSRELLSPGQSQLELLDFRFAKSLVSMGDLLSLEESFRESSEHYETALLHLYKGLEQKDLTEEAISSYQSLIDLTEDRLQLIRVQLTKVEEI